MAAYGSTLTDLGNNIVGQQNADTAATAQQLAYLLGLGRNRNEGDKIRSDERSNDRRFTSEDRRTDAQKETDTLRAMNELRAHLAGTDASIANNKLNAETSRANAQGANETSLKISSGSLQNALELEKIREEYGLKAAAAAALTSGTTPNPAILGSVITANAAEEAKKTADAQAVADALSAQINQPWSYIHPSGARNVSVERANALLQSSGNTGKFLTTVGPDGLARFIPNPASIPAAPSVSDQINMSRPRPMMAPMSGPPPVMMQAPVASPVAPQPVRLYDGSGKAYLVHPDDVQGYIQTRGLSPNPPAPAGGGLMGILNYWHP